MWVEGGVQSRREIYHKPGWCLGRRRMRESPERWRWRARSRQEAVSQGLALLLLEKEKFEKETGERLGAKYVFQTVCVCAHASVYRLTDCQFTWYHLHFPGGVIPRRWLQAGSKKTFASERENNQGNYHFGSFPLWRSSCSYSAWLYPLLPFQEGANRVEVFSGRRFTWVAGWDNLHRWLA